MIFSLHAMFAISWKEITNSGCFDILYLMPCLQIPDTLDSSYWAGLRVVVVAGWWCHLSTVGLAVRDDLGFRSSRPKKISISARIIGVGQPGRERKEASSCASPYPLRLLLHLLVCSVASPPTNQPAAAGDRRSVDRRRHEQRCSWYVSLPHKLSLLFFFFFVCSNQTC